MGTTAPRGTILASAAVREHSGATGRVNPGLTRGASPQRGHAIRSAPMAQSTQILEIRGNLERAYADVFTPEAVAALEALAGLDADRKA